MAWDEWEQLKAAAAARGGTTQMQVDHVPAPDSGRGSAASRVTGGLKSTQAAWNKAGEGVGGLREGIGTALKKLEDGQKGLPQDTGCLSSRAQNDVYASWTRYVRSVNERCGGVQEIFERIGHDLLLTDEAVRAAFGAVDTKFADTPALGGQEAGR